MSARPKELPSTPATASSHPAQGAPFASRTPPPSGDRNAQIARRALTKAQARGFSGRSLSDWRDAEAEYEAEMAARDWALARDFARSNDLLPRDFRPNDPD